MTAKITLPPLRISLLNDIPNHNTLSQQDFYNTKISRALRYLGVFEEMQQKTADNGYTIRIYRAIRETESLARGFGLEEDDDGDETPLQRPEYLAFVFHETLQPTNRNVYVLSTPKAYKHIRDRCSYAFSKHCYSYFSDELQKIDQVSRGQLFSTTRESTLSLRGNLSERISQEDVVYHGLKAIFQCVPGIEGSDIRVEFNDRSVLIQRDLTLTEYARVIGSLPLNLATNAVPHMPGLPANSLTPVQDALTLEELDEFVARYAADYPLPDGWTSILELSERWCASGYKFLISLYTPSGSYPFEHTESYNSPNESLAKIKEKKGLGFTRENMLKGQVKLEYCTTAGLWYGQPLKDCFEGWIKNELGQTFLKVDCIWYQIEDTHIATINNTLRRMLETPGVLLGRGNSGYLDLPWITDIGEEEYNRSYISKNGTSTARWYDGNRKRYSSLEIFDICKVDGDDVFIYHVKETLGTELKKGGAQLLSSAQMIHSCRLKSKSNQDMVSLQAYCSRVGKQESEFLKQALLTKKLHFILAFRGDGDVKKKILDSGSISAKHEIIKLQEQLGELNTEFRFCISPITN